MKAQGTDVPGLASGRWLNTLRPISRPILTRIFPGTNQFSWLARAGAARLLESKLGRRFYGCLRACRVAQNRIETGEQTVMKPKNDRQQNG